MSAEITLRRARTSDRGMRSWFAHCLHHPWEGAALLALICFVAFFVGLGDYHLFDPDEGRSAEVAREMLATGHWLVPTIGFDQFHDKPAFYYWMIASSMRLFGATDYAVRLPGVVAATLCVVATTVWAGRYLGRSTGLLSGLILATTLGFIGMSRIVLTDATFSWWIVAALLYGSAWWMEGRTRGWPTWPFYLLLALATLTKGPAAPVLAALVLVPFAWRTRLPVALRRTRPLQGALILIVVAGTWYGAASLAAPEYVWNFLWNHNVRRYAEGGGGHSASVLTFCYLLPAAYLPWSLYFPTTVAGLVRSARRAPLTYPLLFCVIWVASVVGFFSLSGSKLVTYVLPAFPPLAVLVADGLSGVVAHDADADIPAWVHLAILRALGAVSVAGAAALLVFLHGFAPTRLALAACPLVALVPLALAARSVTAGRHSTALAAVAAFTLLNAGLYYLAVAPALDGVYSFEEPAAMVRASKEPVAVFTYGTSAYSLEYYAGRRAREVRTAAEAAAVLSSSDPVVLVTRERRLDAIRRLATSTVNVWWEGQRSRILLSNRAAPDAPRADARDGVHARTIEPDRLQPVS
jgi:4-amino-4-deoxy-L-arabinose transferase-like glycosyltransferase